MYKPNTRVASKSVPYLALVAQADPDFERRKHREVEYSFSGRVFTADPYRRGSYNQYSNIYPVGQPYGGLDAAVVANAPLYSGVPTGGWA